MARYYGKIGFGKEIETAPDVVDYEVTERTYYGDLLRNFKRNQTSDKLVDDISVSNQISIVADPYAVHNFHAMLYATFMGTKWKVTDVEVQYPRLILSLGGVYNE